jgi:ApbE superfamily uncharacterized protein (UPF0280 family)
MLRPVSRFLDDGNPDGRLHLQHGPIDLIIGVDDGSSAGGNLSFRRKRAFEVAMARFETILEELVSELAVIRAPARVNATIPTGRVAVRMADAVRPFATRHFITPMAAVAGAVADEIISVMRSAFDVGECPSRMYVNNGGDIALHLDETAEFRIRMADEAGMSLGDFAIAGTSRSRGIATSGRGGRSLSMGIADSVTIIAATSAAADAAATIVANAIDLPGHPQIRRARAIDVVDDSDLGERLVVVDCGPMDEPAIDQALSAGALEAERLLDAGLIHRAALFLKNRGRLVVPPGRQADHQIILHTAQTGATFDA